MSSMGEVGDAFSLGGELLELVKDLLLLLLLPLLLLLLLFICWPRRLVCCSIREWILLLPSALKTNNYKIKNKQEKWGQSNHNTKALQDIILSHQRMAFHHHDKYCMLTLSQI